MLGLIDMIASYSSIEKSFDPSLRHRAVVVLTNNDSLICAVCPVARKLGIKKFEPYFKLKDYLEKHNVVIKSSNYELYASVSARYMQTLSRFSNQQYDYSIDEAFQYYPFSPEKFDYLELGKEIRRVVWKELRLPVGVGFGKTLTLCKAANFAAKKLPGYKAVATISTEQQRVEILKKMPLESVWGVGSKLTKRLQIAYGIQTAYDLSLQNPDSMKRFHNVNLEKTVRELNSEPCFTWDEVREPKKQIFSTRSFGERVTQKSDLHQALSKHVEIVARKLREQGSSVKSMIVFAHNSRFDETHSYDSLMYNFSVATCDTQIMLGALSGIIERLYKFGVDYKKCGVGAVEITPTKNTQLSLFDAFKDNANLMTCVDKINLKYGRHSAFFGSSGIEEQRNWEMRREFTSPRFTTRWSDIPKILCE